MSNASDDIKANRIKPIETRYKGYRFRSRLEARWAVYFDALKIKWEYEKEGFDLGEFGYYLPDFWLPQVNMWGEVKPASFSNEESKKAIALVDMTGWPVLQLIGTPDYTTYMAYEPISDDIDIDIQCLICGKANLIHSRVQQCEECGEQLPLDGVFETDYLISMHHNYPREEHRFYSNTEFYPRRRFDGDWPAEGISHAIMKARSARYEHGESS